MRPCDQDQQGLAEAVDRILAPQRQHGLGVQVFDAIPFVSHAGADKMGREQGWNTESERKLERLPERNAQMPPLIKRVERQSKMGQQRAVEKRGAQRIAPQSQKPFAAGFHGIERYQSEGMIEQMCGEIGEEHQARDDPSPPNVHESCANLLRGKRAVYAPQARLIRLGAKVRAERHATLQLSPKASRTASSSRR
jgi:hypothetical protein